MRDSDAEADAPLLSSRGYEFAEGDPVWDIICTLAKKDAAAEPLLSSYMYMSVLSHDTLEQAVSFVLANRLADSTLLPTQLMEIFNSVLFADDDEGVFVRAALRADIKAIRDRDPAPQTHRSPAWLGTKHRQHNPARWTEGTTERGGAT